MGFFVLVSLLTHFFFLLFFQLGSPCFSFFVSGLFFVYYILIVSYVIKLEYGLCIFVVVIDFGLNATKKKSLGSLNLVNAFDGVNSSHSHVVFYN